MNLCSDIICDHICFTRNEDSTLHFPLFAFEILRMVDDAD